jgi:hypothetical protein
LKSILAFQVCFGLSSASVPAENQMSFSDGSTKPQKCSIQRLTTQQLKIRGIGIQAKDARDEPATSFSATTTSLAAVEATQRAPRHLQFTVSTFRHRLQAPKEPERAGLEAKALSTVDEGNR